MAGELLLPHYSSFRVPSPDPTQNHGPDFSDVSVAQGSIASVIFSCKSSFTWEAWRRGHTREDLLLLLPGLPGEYHGPRTTFGVNSSLSCICGLSSSVGPTVIIRDMYPGKKGNFTITVDVG